MIGKVIEEILVAALTAAVIVVIVAWTALMCIAPFALIKLCGMVLLT